MARRARRLTLALCLAFACSRPPADTSVRDRAAPRDVPLVSTVLDAAHPASLDASDALGPSDASGSPADATDGAQGDPMANHLTGKEDLRALARLASGGEGGVIPPVALYGIAPEPGRFNQGNKALAQHAIGHAACERGLRGAAVQTADQRARCHDKPNMVPIFRGGDAGAATACIDVFEYPNEACELPFVWGTPLEAEQLCRAEGKRLCSQSEWTLACAGDPAGGPDRAYAYGDTLDLTVCNTNKPHPFGPDGETWLCSARTAETAWNTCATETEPSGAFPRCRSRFGVYDLHGNVAEMMTRVAGTGAEREVLTQLKGSAFFYVDVARQPSESQKPGTRETYPDHCQYDPRWHVEDLKTATHSNYHLGFRCCLGL